MSFKDTANKFSSIGEKRWTLIISFSEHSMLGDLIYIIIQTLEKKGWIQIVC